MCSWRPPRAVCMLQAHRDREATYTEWIVTYVSLHEALRWWKTLVKSSIFLRPCIKYHREACRASDLGEHSHRALCLCEFLERFWISFGSTLKRSELSFSSTQAGLARGKRRSRACPFRQKRGQNRQMGLGKYCFDK